MNDRELPRTIDAYLKKLRRALSGADKALIQDALYDAEEYLRNELSNNPGRSEAELLAGIASTYGAPEEVADAYRQTEKTVQAALRTPRPRPRRSSLGKFFGILADPRAWTAMIFLLIGLPIGIFLFTWTVTGLALSAGFAILIIGLPFFLLFIASVRLFALVEGRLVEGLLDVRMPRRPVHPGQRKSLIGKLVDMLKDGRTWSTVFYMLLKLPFSIVGYVIVVAGLAIPLALMGSPIVEYVFDQPSLWIDGPIYLPWFGEVGMVIAGALLLVSMMHAFRWVALAQAHLARWLLVRAVEPGAGEAPVQASPDAA